MQIELPREIVERLQTRAQGMPGSSEADVVRTALDALDWLDEDRPSSEQLEATLRELDRSMTEVAEGRTLELEEAKTQVLANLRISPQR